MLSLATKRLWHRAVGDVPLEWYRAEEHIGYDVEGFPIERGPRPDRCVLSQEQCCYQNLLKRA